MEADRKARFTADQNPVLNISAGLDGSRFFLATGGDSKIENYQLNDRIALPNPQQSTKLMIFPRSFWKRMPFVSRFWLLQLAPHSTALNRMLSNTILAIGTATDQVYSWSSDCISSNASMIFTVAWGSR